MTRLESPIAPLDLAAMGSYDKIRLHRKAFELKRFDLFASDLLSLERIYGHTPYQPQRYSCYSLRNCQFGFVASCRPWLSQRKPGVVCLT